MKVRMPHVPDVFNGIKLSELGAALRTAFRDIELSFDKVNVDGVVSENLIIPKRSGQGIKVDVDLPTFGWRGIPGKIAPKSTGAGTPVRAAYAGANAGQFAFVAGDFVDLEFPIPNDYVTGTDIYFRVQWSHNGTTITGNAVFDFYHTYAKGHNQANFPAEKNITITYATTNIATTPQYRHRIDEAIISGASATATLMDRDDIEPDGLVMVRLNLTTLPTISVGGNLFIHLCSIQYQSTNVGTKRKDVATGNFYT